jgi:DNA polymerase III epsilon subunit-like protein
MDKSKERTVVFDCETTGLRPNENSIVALGAVDVATGDTFYEECRIPENSIVNQKALDVNGFTEEQIKDPSKETSEELYKHFIEFCKAHKTLFLAAYNAGFDINFTHSIGKRLKMNGLPPKAYDLMEIAMNEFINNDNIFPLVEKEKIPGKYPKLNETLGYYGLPDERHPHNALTGAQLECEVYTLMKFKEHYLPEYKDVPIAPAIAALNIHFEKYVHDTSVYFEESNK